MDSTTCEVVMLGKTHNYTNFITFGFPETTKTDGGEIQMLGSVNFNQHLAAITNIIKDAVSTAMSMHVSESLIAIAGIQKAVEDGLNDE